MSSRFYSILWCITYYLVVAVVAGCQAFIFDPNSFADPLAAIAMAMPPAYWMISDAKFRQVYVPHVLQPWIVFWWWIVVPVYLVRTRKWWGLLYLVLHVICTLVTATIASFLSIALIWPIVFPDDVW